jgi:hypothetical protein
MLLHEHVPNPYEPSVNVVKVLPWPIKMLARVVLAAIVFFLVALWAWIVGMLAYVI